MSSTPFAAPLPSDAAPLWNLRGLGGEALLEPRKLPAQPPEFQTSKPGFETSDPDDSAPLTIFAAADPAYDNPDPQPGLLDLASAPTLPDDAPDMRVYRTRTIALLNRYFRMSMDLGRLPSLLGREYFRAKVSSYRVCTFEDAVIFTHDVERCLQRLDPFSRQIIARVIFQDYSREEVSAQLRCDLKTVKRRLRDSLDLLALMLIRGGYLNALPAHQQYFEID
jgi:hypothetical protein